MLVELLSCKKMILNGYKEVVTNDIKNVSTFIGSSSTTYTG